MSRKQVKPNKIKPTNTEYVPPGPLAFALARCLGKNDMPVSNVDMNKLRRATLDVVNTHS